MQKEQGMFTYEQQLLARGHRLFAGIDEAGRGPLAGPVVAAAVILPVGRDFPGVNDSKKLLPSRREELYEEITAHALAVATAWVDVRTIDRLNIYRASLLAMKMAVKGLPLRPSALLVDGPAKVPGIDVEQVAVVN